MDNDKYVFVWFYVLWCCMCKVMKLVWDKFVMFYKDEKDIIIVKMDVTKNEAKDLYV